MRLRLTFANWLFARPVVFGADDSVPPRGYLPAWLKLHACQALDTDTRQTEFNTCVIGTRPARGKILRQWAQFARIEVD